VSRKKGIPDGDTQMTFEQIAVKMGISPRSVFNYYKSAMIKIQKDPAAKKLWIAFESSRGRRPF